MRRYSAKLLLLSQVHFKLGKVEINLPKFLVEATRRFFDYLLERRADRRNDDQAAITARLADLGNRVAAEFEKEIRQRLVTLHTWQENAVRMAARRRAEQGIGLFQNAREG
jgi:hypothetical protein